MRVTVAISKDMVDRERLRGGTAVVIDVFLATTTITSIAERQPRRLIPVASEEEALQQARELPGESLVGGESLARKPESFDAGPYPHEYTRERVQGKNVILSTSNGTKAIRMVEEANQVLIACVRNAPATARYIAANDMASVSIVCAGRGGYFCLEDFFCAGAVLHHILLHHGQVSYNDAGWAALQIYRQFEGREWEALAASKVGQFMVRNGEEAVVRYVADMGASDIVLSFSGGMVQIIH
jgi:2-phosphosulfolactate phosphatase